MKNLVYWLAVMMLLVVGDSLPLHMRPPSVPRSLEYAQIRQSQQLPRLSERMAASLNVYYRKSAAVALIDTKPRGTKATCIVCGNRG